MKILFGQEKLLAISSWLGTTAGRAETWKDWRKKISVNRRVRNPKSEISRSSGTLLSLRWPIPALKRQAIVGRPSGTWINLCYAHPALRWAKVDRPFGAGLFASYLSSSPENLSSPGIELHGYCCPRCAHGRAVGTLFGLFEREAHFRRITAICAILTVFSDGDHAGVWQKAQWELRWGRRRGRSRLPRFT